MSEMSEMSIDFGAITGAPAPSAGSAETTVATQVDKALANGGEPGSMSCLAMLTPAQQEQARAMAVQQLPAMLADTDKLATFGDPALTAVNAQVNRIFNEVGPVQIPELTTIMHEINDRMRAFRHHYDPADPRVRETFDRFMDAVRGVFQKGRDMVEMLFEEARSVEQQLDRIAGQLSAKQRELKRNVVLCDELYKSNEASISQLVGVIAVMEAILEQAQMKADGIVVDPNAANAHELTEQRARLTAFSPCSHNSSLSTAFANSEKVKTPELNGFVLACQLCRCLFFPLSRFSNRSCICISTSFRYFFRPSFLFLSLSISSPLSSTGVSFPTAPGK